MLISLFPLLRTVYPLIFSHLTTVSTPLVTKSTVSSLFCRQCVRGLTAAIKGGRCIILFNYLARLLIFVLQAGWSFGDPDQTLVGESAHNMTNCHYRPIMN